MGKIILCIILWMLSSGICFADGLELSDVIRQARESAAKEALQNKAQEPIKEVKNESTNKDTVKEQSAEEKINPLEAVKQEIKTKS